MKDNMRILAALTVIKGSAVCTGVQNRPVRSRLARLQVRLYQDTERMVNALSSRISDKDRQEINVSLSRWAKDPERILHEMNLLDTYSFCDQLLSECKVQGVPIEECIHPEISNTLQKLIEHVENAPDSIAKEPNPQAITIWNRHFKEDLAKGRKIKVKTSTGEIEGIFNHIDEAAVFHMDINGEKTHFFVETIQQITLID